MANKKFSQFTAGAAYNPTNDGLGRIAGFTTGTTVNNIYAMYELGWYYENDKVDYFKQPEDPKTITLQKTATNILGLD